MRLGRAIKTLRILEGIGVRERAKEIGISAATLSRLERGKPDRQRLIVGEED